MTFNEALEQMADNDNLQITVAGSVTAYRFNPETDIFESRKVHDVLGDDVITPWVEVDLEIGLFNAEWEIWKQPTSWAS